MDSEEPADPMAYMEMQAQYLRMLSQYYDAPELQPGESDVPSEPQPMQGEDEMSEEPQEEEKRPFDRPTQAAYSPQSHADLRIQGLPRSFEDNFEPAMEKPRLQTAPRSPRVVSQHAAKKVQSSPQTPSARESKETGELEGNKPAPRAFLKRGQGQLCMQRSSSLSEKVKDSTPNSHPDKPSDDAALSFSEDSKESDQDEDSVSYREEVSRLTTQLKELQREQLRLKADKDRREKKIRELEMMKMEIAKEKNNMQKEFEDWRNAEMAKLRKDKKQGEQPTRVTKGKKEEIEKLRGVVKKLEDEARAREHRHELQIAKLQAEFEEAKQNSARPSVASQPATDLPIASTAKSTGDPSQVSKTTAPDGKIITVFTDGKKEIQFPNGVRKEVFPDEFTVIYFTNNDIKQTFPDGKVVYYFADAQTTQTTFPDNLQIFKFANGQTEKHFPDNTKEITFPDGTVKCIFPDGEEESIFPDGTVQKVDVNGVKFIDFVNGQKDTIYPDGTKVREFADGRVKKILPNGKVVESN